MSPAQTMPKPAEVLADLEQISKQVADSKSVTREVRQFGQLLKGMGSKLVEDTEIVRLTDIGVDRNEVFEIANVLSGWGEKLTPEAKVTWNQEELTNKLALMASLQALGFLTEEQDAKLNELAPTLGNASKATRVSSGTRQERREQPSLPGYPAKVSITADGDEKPFSTQRGNTASSAPNLKGAVQRYWASREVTLSDAELQGYVQAINEVVTENGKPSVNFGGLTFAAVSE